MIEASKLRAGMTFVTNDGKLIKVLEASHHKPGKGILSCVCNCVMCVLGQHLTLATVQKKNLNKQSSKQYQHNTCTKWMILHTS